MAVNRNLNRAIAVMGLIGFLAIAVVCDRVIFFINRQARLEGVNWFVLLTWVESAAILISGVSFILLAWFTLFKLGEDTTFPGLVFLVLGLLLAFYPEMYYYPLLLGIIDYLARYHWTGSILYHSGGLIFALGLLLLIRRKPARAKALPLSS